MNTKDYELYKAPTTEVMELKSEGFICQSGGLQNYNWNTEPEE